MPVSKNRRKNRKKSPTPSKRNSAGLPPCDIPDLRAVEGLMAQFTGDLFPQEGENDALWRAQEIIYDAWEAASKRTRISLAKRALKISPLCADAYALLAEDEAKGIIEKRDYYAKAVAAGEEALGKDAFEEDAGNFWGILETRPYMRARAGLAETVWKLGERKQAIAHWHEMLRLNPHDNQGVRHVLATHLLILDDRKALTALLESYGGDGFMEWAYTRALLAFRQEGASKGARDKLRTAWNRNVHARDYLLGTKQIPTRAPGEYTMGSEDEAILYALENFQAWSATRGALEWLAGATRDLAPPKQG